ncbi:hypothetical protein HYH02_011060 [Chlamydomonas schloesseri]|uniref:WSC domain-containing protein n=1 Tax=Chlamydomonas schloesseri TaxID=2026947 RepID=A0A835W6S0_9CHLO|nr:hypothetical protein HYH02_011060 [Chlamydomonas schloesseri]|eukprot:KAG2437681.1 hypothetical protein HYH02_011060 [Chlamydomonas schloesseri]
MCSTAAGRASSTAIVRQTSTDLALLARQRSLSGEDGANSSTQIFIRLAGSGDKCLQAAPARQQLVGVRGCNTSEPNQVFVLKAATGNDTNLYSIASAQQPAYVLDFYVPNNTVGVWSWFGGPNQLWLLDSQATPDRGGSATAIQTARYPDSPICVEPAPAGEGQPDLRLAPCDLSNRQLFFLVAPGGGLCTTVAGSSSSLSLEVNRRAGFKPLPFDETALAASNGAITQMLVSYSVSYDPYQQMHGIMVMYGSTWGPFHGGNAAIEFVRLAPGEDIVALGYLANFKGFKVQTSTGQTKTVYNLDPEAADSAWTWVTEATIPRPSCAPAGSTPRLVAIAGADDQSPFNGYAYFGELSFVWGWAAVPSSPPPSYPPAPPSPAPPPAVISSPSPAPSPSRAHDIGGLCTTVAGSSSSLSLEVNRRAGFKPLPFDETALAASNGAITQMLVSYSVSYDPYQQMHGIMVMYGSTWGPFHGGNAAIEFVRLAPGEDIVALGYLANFKGFKVQTSTGQTKTVYNLDPEAADSAWTWVTEATIPRPSCAPAGSTPRLVAIAGADDQSPFNGYAYFGELSFVWGWAAVPSSPPPSYPPAPPSPAPPPAVISSPSPAPSPSRAHDIGGLCTTVAGSSSSLSLEVNRRAGFKPLPFDETALAASNGAITQMLVSYSVSYDPYQQMHGIMVMYGSTWGPFHGGNAAIEFVRLAPGEDIVALGYLANFKGFKVQTSTGQTKTVYNLDPEAADSAWTWVTEATIPRPSCAPAGSTPRLVAIAGADDQSPFNGYAYFGELSFVWGWAAVPSSPPPSYPPAPPSPAPPPAVISSPSPAPSPSRAHDIGGLCTTVAGSSSSLSLEVNRRAGFKPLPFDETALAASNGAITQMLVSYSVSYDPYQQMHGIMVMYGSTWGPFHGGNAAIEFVRLAPGEDIVALGYLANFKGFKVQTSTGQTKTVYNLDPEAADSAWTWVTEATIPRPSCAPAGSTPRLVAIAGADDQSPFNGYAYFGELSFVWGWAAVPSSPPPSYPPAPPSPAPPPAVISSPSPAPSPSRAHDIGGLCTTVAGSSSSLSLEVNRRAGFKPLPFDETALAASNGAITQMLVSYSVSYDPYQQMHGIMVMYGSTWGPFHGGNAAIEFVRLAPGEDIVALGYLANFKGFKVQTSTGQTKTVYNLDPEAADSAWTWVTEATIPRPSCAPAGSTPRLVAIAGADDQSPFNGYAYFGELSFVWGWAAVPSSPPPSYPPAPPSPAPPPAVISSPSPAPSPSRAHDIGGLCTTVAGSSSSLSLEVNRRAGFKPLPFDETALAASNGAITQMLVSYSVSYDPYQQMHGIMVMYGSTWGPFHGGNAAIEFVRLAPGEDIVALGYLANFKGFKVQTSTGQTKTVYNLDPEAADLAWTWVTEATIPRPSCAPAGSTPRLVAIAGADDQSPFNGYAYFGELSFVWGWAAVPSSPPPSYPPAPPSPAPPPAVISSPSPAPSPSRAHDIGGLCTTVAGSSSSLSLEVNRRAGFKPLPFDETALAASNGAITQMLVSYSVSYDPYQQMHGIMVMYGSTWGPFHGGNAAIEFVRLAPGEDIVALGYLANFKGFKVQTSTGQTKTVYNLDPEAADSAWTWVTEATIPRPSCAPAGSTPRLVAIAGADDQSPFNGYAYFGELSFVWGWAAVPSSPPPSYPPAPPSPAPPPAVISSPSPAPSPSRAHDIGGLCTTVAGSSSSLSLEVNRRAGFKPLPFDETALAASNGAITQLLVSYSVSYDPYQQMHGIMVMYGSTWGPFHGGNAAIEFVRLAPGEDIVALGYLANFKGFKVQTSTGQTKTVYNLDPEAADSAWTWVTEATIPRPSCAPAGSTPRLVAIAGADDQSPFNGYAYFGELSFVWGWAAVPSSPPPSYPPAPPSPAPPPAVISSPSPAPSPSRAHDIGGLCTTVAGSSSSLSLEVNRRAGFKPLPFDETALAASNGAITQLLVSYSVSYDPYQQMHGIMVMYGSTWGPFHGGNAAIEFVRLAPGEDIVALGYLANFKGFKVQTSTGQTKTVYNLDPEAADSAWTWVTEATIPRPSCAPAGSTPRLVAIAGADDQSPFNGYAYFGELSFVWGWAAVPSSPPPSYPPAPPSPAPPPAVISSPSPAPSPSRAHDIGGLCTTVAGSSSSLSLEVNRRAGFKPLPFDETALAASNGAITQMLVSYSVSYDPYQQMHGIMVMYGSTWGPFHGGNAAIEFVRLAPGEDIVALGYLANFKGFKVQTSTGQTKTVYNLDPEAADSAWTWVTEATIPRPSCAPAGSTPRLVAIAGADDQSPFNGYAYFGELSFVWGWAAVPSSPPPSYPPAPPSPAPPPAVISSPSPAPSPSRAHDIGGLCTTVAGSSSSLSLEVNRRAGFKPLPFDETALAASNGAITQLLVSYSVSYDPYQQMHGIMVMYGSTWGPFHGGNAAIEFVRLAPGEDIVALGYLANFKGFKVQTSTGQTKTVYNLDPEAADSAWTWVTEATIPRPSCAPAGSTPRLVAIAGADDQSPFNGYAYFGELSFVWGWAAVPSSPPPSYPPAPPSPAPPPAVISSPSPAPSPSRAHDIGGLCTTVAGSSSSLSLEVNRRAGFKPLPFDETALAASNGAITQMLVSYSVSYDPYQQMHGIMVMYGSTWGPFHGGNAAIEFVRLAPGEDIVALGYLANFKGFKVQTSTGQTKTVYNLDPEAADSAWTWVTEATIPRPSCAPAGSTPRLVAIAGADDQSPFNGYAYFGELSFVWGWAAVPSSPPPSYPPAPPSPAPPPAVISSPSPAPSPSRAHDIGGLCTTVAGSSSSLSLEVNRRAGFKPLPFDETALAASNGAITQLLVSYSVSYDPYQQMHGIMVMYGSTWGPFHGGNAAIEFVRLAPGEDIVALGYLANFKGFKVQTSTGQTKTVYNLDPEAADSAWTWVTEATIPRPSCAPAGSTPRLVAIAGADDQSPFNGYAYFGELSFVWGWAAVPSSPPPSYPPAPPSPAPPPAVISSPSPAPSPSRAHDIGGLCTTVAGSSSSLSLEVNRRAGFKPLPFDETALAASNGAITQMLVSYSVSYDPYQQMHGIMVMYGSTWGPFHGGNAAIEFVRLAPGEDIVALGYLANFKGFKVQTSTGQTKTVYNLDPEAADSAWTWVTEATIPRPSCAPAGSTPRLVAIAGADDQSPFNGYAYFGELSFVWGWAAVPSSPPPSYPPAPPSPAPPPAVISSPSPAPSPSRAHDIGGLCTTVAGSSSSLSLEVNRRAGFKPLPFDETALAASNGAITQMLVSYSVSYDPYQQMHGIMVMYGSTWGPFHGGNAAIEFVRLAPGEDIVALGYLANFKGFKVQTSTGQTKTVYNLDPEAADSAWTWVTEATIPRPSCAPAGSTPRLVAIAGADDQSPFNGYAYFGELSFVWGWAAVPSSPPPSYPPAPPSPAPPPAVISSPSPAPSPSRAHDIGGLCTTVAGSSSSLSLEVNRRAGFKPLPFDETALAASNGAITQMLVSYSVSYDPYQQMHGIMVMYGSTWGPFHGGNAAIEFVRLAPGEDIVALGYLANFKGFKVQTSTGQTKTVYNLDPEAADSAWTWVTEATIPRPSCAPAGSTPRLVAIAGADDQSPFNGYAYFGELSFVWGWAAVPSSPPPSYPPAPPSPAPPPAVISSPSPAPSPSRAHDIGGLCTTVAGSSSSLSLEVNRRAGFKPLPFDETALAASNGAITQMLVSYSVSYDPYQQMHGIMVMYGSTWGPFHGGNAAIEFVRLAPGEDIVALGYLANFKGFKVQTSTGQTKTVYNLDPEAADSAWTWVTEATIPRPSCAPAGSTPRLVAIAGADDQSPFNGYAYFGELSFVWGWAAVPSSPPPSYPPAPPSPAPPPAVIPSPSPAPSPSRAHDIGGLCTTVAGSSSSLSLEVNRRAGFKPLPFDETALAASNGAITQMLVSYSVSYDPYQQMHGIMVMYGSTWGPFHGGNAAIEFVRLAPGEDIVALGYLANFKGFKVQTSTGQTKTVYNLDPEAADSAWTWVTEATIPRPSCAPAGSTPRLVAIAGADDQSPFNGYAYFGELSFVWGWAAVPSSPPPSYPPAPPSPAPPPAVIPSPSPAPSPSRAHDIGGLCTTVAGSSSSLSLEVNRRAGFKPLPFDETALAASNGAITQMLVSYSVSYDPYQQMHGIMVMYGSTWGPFHGGNAAIEFVRLAPGEDIVALGYLANFKGFKVQTSTGQTKTVYNLDPEAADSAWTWVTEATIPRPSCAPAGSTPRLVAIAGADDQSPFNGYAYFGELSFVWGWAAVPSSPPPSYPPAPPSPAPPPAVISSPSPAPSPSRAHDIGGLCTTVAGSSSSLSLEVNRRAGFKPLPFDETALAASNGAITQMLVSYSVSYDPYQQMHGIMVMYGSTWGPFHGGNAAIEFVRLAPGEDIVALGYLANFKGFKVQTSTGQTKTVYNLDPEAADSAWTWVTEATIPRPSCAPAGSTPRLVAIAGADDQSPFNGYAYFGELSFVWGWAAVPSSPPPSYPPAPPSPAPPPAVIPSPSPAPSPSRAHDIGGLCTTVAGSSSSLSLEVNRRAGFKPLPFDETALAASNGAITQMLVSYSVSYDPYQQMHGIMVMYGSTWGPFHGGNAAIEFVRLAPGEDIVALGYLANFKGFKVQTSTGQTKTVYNLDPEAADSAWTWVTEATIPRPSCAPAGSTPRLVAIAGADDQSPFNGYAYFGELSFVWGWAAVPSSPPPPPPAAPTQAFIRLAGSGDKCLEAAPARRQLVGVRGCNTSEPNQVFVLVPGNDTNLYSIASAQQPAYVLDFYVPNNTVGMWSWFGGPNQLWLLDSQATPDRGGSATAIQTARYPDSPTCVEPAPAGEGQSDLRLAPCDVGSSRQLFFLVAPQVPLPPVQLRCPSVPGYSFVAGFDQLDSVSIVRAPFDSWTGQPDLLAAAKACDSLCECVGLNSDGYLKRGSHNLLVDKRAVQKDRCWGLYVRKQEGAASRTCSPIKAPPNYPALPDRHLGCVQDGTPRVMKLLARDDALMTRRLCGLLARSAGQECYGSNADESSIRRLGESFQCWRPCTGDGSEGCGGDWSIDLYLVDGDLFLPAAPPAAPLPACPEVSGYTFMRFTDQTAASAHIVQTSIGNLTSVGKAFTSGGQLKSSAAGLTTLRRGADICAGLYVRNDAARQQASAGNGSGNNATATRTCDAPGAGAPFPTDTSLGCIWDSLPRVMPVRLANDPARMTRRLCSLLARAAGLKHYGVEYGQECYGSNEELAVIRQKGESQSCNRACVGDGSGGCGGGWSISLYLVG